MDPITAIGLASSIIPFIDFGCKVIACAKEIRESSTGISRDGKSAEAITTEMRGLVSKLQTPAADANATDEERALCRIAGECDAIAKDIVALLDKGRSKKQGASTLASLQASLFSARHDGDFRKLQARLNDCRDQLHLQFDYLTSSQNRKKLDAMVALGVSDSSRMLRIEEQIQHLCQRPATTALDDESLVQLKALLGVSSSCIQGVARRQVIEQLDSPDMSQRFDAVEDAHTQTFSWLLLDEDDSSEDGGEESRLHSLVGTYPSSNVTPVVSSSYLGSRRDDHHHAIESVMDDAKTAAKHDFHHWLRSGSDIFWVAGKLGSGKSTMMKLLCRHDQTRVLLSEWAGHRKLVLADFFFWKFGSRLQSTLAGLVHSLLYGIITSTPDLIPELFPELWGAAQTLEASRINPEEHDLLRAFKRLVSSVSSFDKYRFCFFIDGLDEYSETPNYDHKHLVGLLLDWAKWSQGSVKLCVSSREYNVYLNAFGDCPKIRLQDVTRSDMELYAMDRLRHIEPPEDGTRLASSVVDHSGGIFLWVSLVTMRLREQYDNGYPYASLIRELNALPKELETLYTYIIDTQPDSDRKRAYRTFAMAMVGQREDEEDIDMLSPLSYFFFERYLENPRFAVQDIQANNIRPRPSDDEVVSMVDLARRQLNGCCKGLLEIVAGQRDSYDLGPPETSGSNSETIRHAVEKRIVFTHRSVVEFLTPRVASERDGLLMGFDALDAVSNLLLVEVSLDLAVWNDRFTKKWLLRSIHRADEAPYPFVEAWAKAVVPARKRMARRSSQPDDQPVESSTALHPHFTTSDNVASRLRDIYYRPQHPIYNLAAFGQLSYVRWKLSRESDPKLCSYGALLVLMMGGVQPVAEVSLTLDLLLRLGLSADECITHFCTLIINYDPQEDTTTPWHFSLVNARVEEAYAAFDRRQMEVAGIYLEKFLENGADRRVECRLVDGELVITAGAAQTQQRYRLLKTPVGQDYEAGSLEEFINSLQLPNKARLLELCMDKKGKTTLSESRLAPEPVL